jgi:hypothetical protein
LQGTLRRKRWPRATRVASAWTLAVASAALGPGAALAAGVSHAGALPPVRLDVDPCVSVEPARLIELLQLELTVLTDAGASPPQPKTRARIACDGATVVLSVSDEAGAEVTERRLDWTDYPPGSRPRLLALTLSEMIARRWKEAPVAPQVAFPAALASTETRIGSGKDPRPLVLGLLATVERLGRPPTTTSGLDLVLAWRARPWLEVFGGGRAATSSFDTTPGRVSTHTLSVLLAGLLGLTQGRFWLGAGPGVRGGWAWLRGEPRASASTTATAGRPLNAAWWGPVVVGAVGLQASRHLVVLLNLEAGYVARPVVGDVAAPGPAPGPTATVALDRLWLTASAGVAWRF